MFDLFFLSPYKVYDIIIIGVNFWPQNLERFSSFSTFTKLAQYYPARELDNVFNIHNPFYCNFVANLW